MSIRENVINEMWEKDTGTILVLRLRIVYRGISAIKFWNSNAGVANRLPMKGPELGPRKGSRAQGKFNMKKHAVSVK